jgi:hypothetical protein
MAGFGDKLRGERQARRRSIEEISAATGIGQSYLEALEKEEFHALPGRAFGKLYIRAYAEALDFDPRPLLEEYDRARAAAPEGVPASSPAEPSGPRRAREAVAVWREAMMGERQKARARAVPAGSEAANGAQPHAAVTPEAGPSPAMSDAGSHAVEATHAGPLPGAGLPHDAPSRPSLPWTGRPGWRRAAVAALVFVGLFGAAATLYYTSLRRGIEASHLADPVPAPPSVAPAAAPTAAAANPEPPVPSIEPPVKPARRRRPTAPIATPPGPSSMSILESGLGRLVAGRRLLEPAGSFPEGSIVWFSTRVTGGAPGERIRHVWIREGRPVQSIPLRIGARDWRTHSRKTVYGAGQWAVEARDESGRVLARAEFTCDRPRP